MLLTIVGIHGIRSLSKGKLIEILSGEDIAEFTMYSFSDDKVSSKRLIDDNKKTVVFYLSTSCGSCIELLDTIHMLVNLTSSDFSYAIIWEDEIPLRRLNKHNIDEQINYSLKNKVRLSDFNPYAFIIDNKDKKILIETGNLNSIINKIINTFSKEDLRSLSDQYFYAENSKEIILYFETNNCESCIEASNKIDSLSSQLFVININSEPSIKLGNYSNIYDVYGIYKNIYNIKTYPAIIQINREGSILVPNVFDYLDSF